MKKTLLSFIFLPLVVTNSSNVETIIETEATGENASVHTEITNIINGKEVKVESNQPGEIRVEVKNGEVNVESSPDAKPTIIISDESEGETEEVNETEEEITGQLENFKNQVYSFVTELFSRLSRFFHIRS